MKINTNKQITLNIICLSILSISMAHADQTTIINNNYGTPAPNDTNAPNNTSQSYGTNTPPGTYIIKHGDGSSEQVYTTGDKKPYIVDSGNNSSPVAQPYVYVQPPLPGPVGPTPFPGPRPGSMSGAIPHR